MKEIRVSIAFIVIALIAIGITMIFSSSFVYALEQYNDAYYFLKRHLLFLLVGVIGTACIMAIDYRDLQKIAKPLLMGSIILLVLVLIPGIGKSISGARRWFKIGVFSFQPSELAKLTVLIYTADFLARKKEKITSFVEGFMPLLMILGITCLLIVKQPDLGNSVLIASIVFIMMFVAGAQMLHMSILVLMTIPVLFFLITKVAYRLKRIIAFIDPWKDSQGVGFQLTQSQIALGSGGILGIGLGQSKQKLFYLPAAHTDFILSIIGEEMGLIGALLVVLLFVIFIWQGARIAKRTHDPFGYFLAVGIVTMIGLQAIVNIGVSIGALPTKGLPLPFISYGGSALIFNMMAVGLLLNISRVQDI
jgi:cell division protein FtsW